MIAHLSYVMCDLCGNPAQPADSAAEARKIAKTEGFARGAMDVCPRCQTREVTLLTLGREHGGSVYTRHRAAGDRTVCNIELAGTTVPDPPDIGTPRDCRKCFAAP